MKKFKKFDDSQYDVIVFDEICLADMKFLRRILKYSQDHPDKIIICTGDPTQNESINILSNCLNYDEYLNHCINCIFLIELP
jgi:ATP-dependent exoDNAse (exonuclease V) alpha subunit